MTSQEAKDSLGAQVYQRMAEKGTAELAAIWQENDREAWTDEAFEAVETILLERLGALPEPEVDDQPDGAGNIVVEYPTDKKLIWIADLCNRLSWVILIVAIIYALLRAINYFQFGISWSQLGNMPIFSAAMLVLLIFIAGTLDGVLYGGFAFLVLQAIAEGIYMLMDIRDLLQIDADIEDANIEDADFEESGR
jgi:hypothetical protein